MKYRPTFSTILCGAIFFGFSIHASEKKPEISGKVEGDIHSNWHYDFRAEHSMFEISRAYFGYFMTINKRYSGRIMFDVGRLSLLTDDTEIDVTTGNSDGSVSDVVLEGSMDEREIGYLKYAYIQIDDIVPVTSILFGLHCMSQFKVQEKFWGYRYIAKSFMDAAKMGHSADLGVTVKVHPLEILTVNATVSNGEGYKKSQDSNGLYKASLGTQLTLFKELTSYFYADVMAWKGDRDALQSTVAGFIGFKSGFFRIGGEIDYRGNHNGGDNTNLLGFSIYSTASVGIYSVFARYDNLSSHDDWNSANDNSLVITGIEISPVKNLKIAPNVQVEIPSETGGDDITTTLLLQTQFKF